MKSFSVAIPQPCAENWAGVTPTGLGRHYAACQKTVASTFLSWRWSNYLGSTLPAPSHSRPPAHYLGRRGVLAIVAWGAWLSAAGQAPAASTAIPETIVVRGVVLDDSLNVPVPEMWLYLNETKYGAVTDAQGNFTFSFPSGWKPVRGGELRIFVVPVGYTFKPLRRQLDWRAYDPTHPLVLRLASAPGRGRPNLHGFRLMAAPVPPPVYPARAHTARP